MIIRLWDSLGTQEYGKTYTAVRLMWEYYNRGYEPGWIKGGEPAERVEVRRKLEDIRAELKPGHIIYFEDPFGKTEYERREGLEREIGTIIDTVRQVEDVYVIVTSREEVFKEFEKEKLSAKNLAEFEKKLNIKKPSYDYEKRKENLLKWAEEENCKWFGNKELKELVLESIKDEKILPTPLSIKDFAVATFDIEKESELKEKIEEKSKETAKAFAEEIKNMADDKILFLSILFVSHHFGVEFLRVTYRELVKELNLEYAWDFDRVFTWFKDDKIACSGDHICFSHPSYSEALPYLLVEDGYITRINKEIFSKVLVKLSEKAAENVAWVVVDIFDKLSEDTRNLLFRLAKDDYSLCENVTFFVLKNYHRRGCSADIINLLFRIAENGEDTFAAVYGIAWGILESFQFREGVHEDVKDIILSKLLRSDKVLAFTCWQIITTRIFITDIGVEKLLFKLAEEEQAASYVAWAIYKRFTDNKLPEDVRNKLLLVLSEKEDTPTVSKTQVKIYCSTCKKEFQELTGNCPFCGGILYESYQGSEAALYPPALLVAQTLSENFDRLPEGIRSKLLFTLSKKEIAAGNVALTIADNFNKLPEEVRGLFDRLQHQLLEEIEESFSMLDKGLVIRILDKLIKEGDAETRMKAQALMNSINEFYKACEHV